MKDDIDELAAIIITGDFIVHRFKYGEYSKKDPWPTEAQKLATIQAMWANLTQEILKRFPDTKILCTFGNNDNMRNYLPPLTLQEKNDIFGFLFKTWFDDIPANLKNVTMD